MCRFQQLLLLASLQATFSFSPRDANSALRILSSKPVSELRYLKSDESSLFIPPNEGDIAGDSCLADKCSQSQGRKRSRKGDDHHSASDWLYNLKTWRNSSVLREIKHPVMCLTAWATFVSIVQKALLLSGNARWAMSFCIPHAAHSFLVSSLGLLLVFRTNSAYQRFLEGRKIWEHILTTSRNLSRMTTLYRNEVGSERRTRLLHLLASFPYLLKHHVQSKCLCSKDPKQIKEHDLLLLQEPSKPGKHCWTDRSELPWTLIQKARHQKREKVLEKIGQSTNRPLWICDRMGQEIMGIPASEHFTSRERLKLLGDIDKLANAVGSCERIHQTAVPLHYARHALRSLTVWIVTLPFSLVKDFGLLTGPVTAIIAWLLFGVYQIGHSIEDPFQGSLRLSSMCEDIRIDVLACDNARSSAFDMVDEDAIMATEPELQLPNIEMDIFPRAVHSNQVSPQTRKLVLADGEFAVVG